MRLFYLLIALLYVQNIGAQVSGVVRDETGEPLPYVTIYVKNTSIGTVSNATGLYSLNAAKGTVDVVFQYIGYKTEVRTVEIGSKPVQLNVEMEPSSLELGEVIITDQNPGERIMRQVIAKREYHKSQLASWSCDAYIKGFYKLKDVPEKLMGQDIGDMGGILDTSRSGVLYLSESVSRVHSQLSPARRKEVMISSKVSGNMTGFSMNRSNLVDFDLYNQTINVERDILSPLADNAFSYYNFNYLGSYTDPNGFTIEKIQVLPKRSSDPVFSGNLYVVDSWWNLAGADLFVTGANVKQPILDTMRIQQQFVLLDRPDLWRVISQTTSFRFNLFGFGIEGFFNGVFSRYELNTEFGKDFWGKEVFKVEDGASDRDTSYWSEIRPVPLTDEEVRDYTRKDSLQRIWNSEAWQDSLDRAGNKFETSDLLTGYTWENTRLNRSFTVPGPLNWVQFNTVQGWLFDAVPELMFKSDRDGTRFWNAKAGINYGFAEKRLRGWLSVRHKLESIRQTEIQLTGGTRATQFNEGQPIGHTLNELYTLWFGRNYMKLFDKTFLQLEFGQHPVPGFSYNVSADWARRSPLENNSDFRWRKSQDPAYTPNVPVPDLIGATEFPAPDIFALEVNLRFSFRETYSSYPGQRIYAGSGLPVVDVRYRKAIPGLFGGDADFDFMSLQVSQDYLKWGLAGYSEWSVRTGAFLRNRKMSFMDLYQPLGNQTFIFNPNQYSRRFPMLPYYAYATDQPFVEAHFQHHLQGILLDRIPGLRKLNLKEVFGAGVYYANQASMDPFYTGKLPYWEVNIGFENIGIKAVRPLRIDVVSGFFGNEYYRTAVILGLKLM